MYLCKVCGNTEYFIERNLIETELHFDESGKIVGQCDHFQECVEVVCGKCKASSNDRNVTNMKQVKHYE